MRQKEFDALAMAVESVQRLCERERIERENSIATFRKDYWPQVGVNSMKMDIRSD